MSGVLARFQNQSASTTDDTPPLMTPIEAPIVATEVPVLNRPIGAAASIISGSIGELLWQIVGVGGSLCLDSRV